MSCVHYKFKSSLDYDIVKFDGLHISVADLKKAILQQKMIGKSSGLNLNKAILQQKKIGKSSGFDLLITNAQTKEEYKDDSSLILKNSSVIVARVPLVNTKIKLRERCDSPSGSSKAIEDEPSQIPFDKLSKYEKNIKRSTGIPRSFMVTVNGPGHKGVMMTRNGQYAIPIINVEAYKEGKKERPPFSKEKSPEKIQEVRDIPCELLCLLCRNILEDAVLIRCCGNSYCDECIRETLLDTEEHECPTCHETEISPDSLICNKFLRQAVNNYTNNPYSWFSSQPKSAAKIEEPKPVVTSPTSTPQQRPGTPVKDEKHIEGNISPRLIPEPNLTPSKSKDNSNRESAKHISEKVVPVLGQKPEVRSTRMPPSAHFSAVLGLPLRMRKEPPQRHTQKTHYRNSDEGRGRNSGIEENIAISLLPPPLSHSAYMPQQSSHILAPPHIPQLYPPAQHIQMPPLVGLGPSHPGYRLPPPGKNLPPGMPLPPPPQPPPPGLGPPICQMQPLHPAESFPFPPIAPVPPPLSEEEFYREQRRLKEEEKKSYPLDDFAQESLEYKCEQRRQCSHHSSSRSYLRSSSHSFSHSRTRFRSKSRSKYSSRYHSRSRSRSQSHNRRHGLPLNYRYKSKSPYKRGRSPHRRDYSPGFHQSSPAYRYPNPHHPNPPHQPLPPIPYSDDRAPHYYPPFHYDIPYRYNEAREPRFDPNFEFVRYEDSFREHNKCRRSFSPVKEPKKTHSRSPVKAKPFPRSKDKYSDVVEEKHKKKHKKRPKKELKDSKENKNVTEDSEDIKDGKERKEKHTKRIIVDNPVERKKEPSKSKVLLYETNPDVAKEMVLVENSKSEEEQMAQLEYRKQMKLKEKRKCKLKEAGLLPIPKDIETPIFPEEKVVDNNEESEGKGSVNEEKGDKVLDIKGSINPEPNQSEIEEREEGADTDSSDADDDQILKVYMPELSKWEREELEEDSKPISPVRKFFFANKPSVPTLDSTSSKLNERRVFTSDKGSRIQFNQEGRSSARYKDTERKVRDDSEALQVTISTSYRDQRSVEKWEMDVDKYHNQEKITRSPESTGKLIEKKGIEKHEKLPRDSERFSAHVSRNRSPRLREEFLKTDRSQEYDKIRPKSKALAKFDREREQHHATKYFRSERIPKENEFRHERKVEKKESKEKRSREKPYEDSSEKTYGMKVSICRPISSGSLKERDERKPIEDGSRRKEEKKISSENYVQKNKKEMHLSKSVHKIDSKETKIADHKELSLDESTFEPDYNFSD